MRLRPGDYAFLVLLYSCCVSVVEGAFLQNQFLPALVRRKHAHSDNPHLNNRNFVTAMMVMKQQPILQDEEEEEEAMDALQMKSLYAEVAEDDSAWFQEFVIDILGEDNLGTDLMGVNGSALSQQEKEQRKQKQDEIQSPEEVISKDEMKILGEENNESDYQDESVATNRKNKPIDASASSSESNDTIAISAVDNEDSPSMKVKDAIDEGIRTTSSLMEQQKEDGADNDMATNGQVQTTTQQQLEDTLNEGTTTKATNADGDPVPSSSLSGVATSTTLKTQKDSDATPTGEDAVSVVLYRDGTSRRQSWQRVPLSDLEALGYSKEDVRSLQADALELIIDETVQRPRMGIPSRWKQKESLNDDVRVVSFLEADQVCNAVGKDSDVGLIKNGKRDSSHQEALSPETGNKSQNSPVVDTDNVRHIGEELEEKATAQQSQRHAKSEGKGQQRSSRKESVDSYGKKEPLPSGGRKQRQIDREGPVSSASTLPKRERRRRSRERSSRRPNGERKPLYSGRPSPMTNKKKQRPGDPPPPRGFWPDVHTFRDLLRKEASMRISIVGDDFADAVKDESDWRLQLYTDWLWTLHGGVGEPIIESRTDRNRRKRSQRYAERDIPAPRSPRRRHER